MANAPRIIDAYLKLGDASERQQQGAQRDQFLLLAGSLAGVAGFPQIAEDCRKKILEHNPFHFLTQYSTMQAALASRKVRRHARTLLRVYPYSKAKYLLHKLHAFGQQPSHVYEELLSTPVVAVAQAPADSKSTPVEPGAGIAIDSAQPARDVATELLADPPIADLELFEPVTVRSTWRLSVWIAVFFALAIGFVGGTMLATWLYPYFMT